MSGGSASLPIQPLLSLTTDLRDGLRNVAPEHVTLEHFRLLRVAVRPREREARLIGRAYRTARIEQDPVHAILCDLRLGGGLVQHDNAAGKVRYADRHLDAHLLRDAVQFGHFPLDLRVRFGRIDVHRAQIRDARKYRALLVDLGHWNRDGKIVALKIHLFGIAFHLELNVMFAARRTNHIVKI